MAISDRKRRASESASVQKRRRVANAARNRVARLVRKDATRSDVVHVAEVASMDDDLSTDPSRVVTGMEANAARQRLKCNVETTARNVFNQIRGLLEDTISINAKNKDGKSNMHSDRESFYIDIDCERLVVCVGCGEMVSKSKVKITKCSEAVAYFKILKADEVGIIEAAIVGDGDDSSTAFCNRCVKSLSKGKVPKYSRASGFCLAAVPDVLALLNPMESRMIGLGQCFTTCYRLPGGQECSRGNSISYWNDVPNLVKRLPRPVSNCGVVRLNVNRDANAERFFYVRPDVIRSALQWLIIHNPLYSNVDIAEDVLNDIAAVDGSVDVPAINVESCDLETSVRENANDTDHSSTGTNETAIAEPDVDKIGNVVPREYDQNIGIMNREVQHYDESDIIESCEVNASQSSSVTEDELIVRSLESIGGIPEVSASECTDTMNEFTTHTLMQVCFPTLFPDGLGGFKPMSTEDRMESVDLTDFCAHLMSFHDRRFVIHRSFKFFCLNVIQRRQIDGLTRRIHSRHVEDLVQDGDPITKKLDELKPYFKCVRGSGLYWAKVRDELMAMIGNDALPTRWPTYFFTLSAADTIWPEFFRVCDSRLSLEDAKNLSATARQRYLNENPDIASRHFNNRFKSFFKNIINGKDQPLGEIVDYFWRVEFQKRGSPHIHGLLWVRDAPDVLNSCESEHGREELASFIDKHICANAIAYEDYRECMCSTCLSSVDKTKEDPLMFRPPKNGFDSSESQCDVSRVARRVQQHVCGRQSSCHAKTGACRFNFPKQIRDCTEIKTKRTERGALGIQILYKRNSAHTNNYCPKLLQVWRANMDIKMIGNAYGAAEYTASYVSKAEPDSSRFRKAISNALEKCSPDMEHQNVLRRIANATIAVREVSAQEAMWILLNGLEMYGKSRNVLRVKTLRHDRRYYRIDPIECCRDLVSVQEAVISNDEDMEVRLESLERLYMARPDTDLFNQMNYKTFCQRYEISKDAPRHGQQLRRYECQNNQGYVKERRTQQAIVKSPRCRIDRNNADYCFGEIFLRIPWRQLTDLPHLDIDCIESFGSLCNDTQKGRDLIMSISRDENLRLLQDETFVSDEMAVAGPAWNIYVQPCTTSDNHNANSDGNSNIFSSTRYSLDDIIRAQSFVKHDINEFMKERKRRKELNAVSTGQQKKTYLYPINLVEENMNADQWSAFGLCMNQSRLRLAAQQSGQKCGQQCIILNGEGGCGKSWLIRHVVKDIHHVFGDNCSVRRSKRVLLLAHYGSAAFNIKGRTICSALGLSKSVNYASPYVPLQSTSAGIARLHSIQKELRQVHMVIIDEFSVISSAMLYWISERMKEIWPARNTESFGGCDVILAGDLGQLSPVRPSSLIIQQEQLKNSYQRHGRKLWESLDVCQLNMQNRGMKDLEWYDALRRLRNMDHSDEDIALFNTRYIKINDRPPWSKTATYIAYRNDDVDRANNECIDTQSNPVVNIKALHEIDIMRGQDEPMDSRVVEQLLQQSILPNTTRDNEVPISIKLAVGCPVRLTANLHQQSGLCNGTRAVVHDFMIPPGANGLPIVLVQITDKYIGPSFDKSIPNIVPIVPRTMRWGAKNSIYRTVRTCLPLRLAYGTTIHKVQGLTCNKLVFDTQNLPNSSFGYVGLSRVRTRNDIILTQPLVHDENQTQKDAKLRLNTENSRLATRASTLRQETAQNTMYMQALAATLNINSSTLR